MFFWLIAFSILASTFAQLPYLGRCPEPQRVPKLNITELSGKWYEVATFFNLPDAFLRCISVEFTPNKDGSVSYTRSQISRIFQFHSEFHRISLPGNESKPGRLISNFFSGWLNIPEEYWFLTIDTNRYVVIWGCLDVFLINIQVLWIFTRESNPPQSLIDEIQTKITETNIDTSRLMVLNVNCR